MAEGGCLPWKQQKIDLSRGPVANYSAIQKPLPKPPNGVEWQKDETNNEWRLVRVEDEEKQKRKYKLKVGTCWNANTGRVAPTLEHVPKKDDDITSRKEEMLQNDSPSEKAAVENVDYVVHTVLPSDTIQGLCLRYKTKPTTLRQLNKFSGSNLLLAPHKLIIPLSENCTLQNIQLQDKNCRQYKMQTLMAEVPGLTESERRAYLEMSDWNLDEAIASAKDDDEWEKSQCPVRKQKTVPHRPKAPPTHSKTLLDVHTAIPAETILDMQERESNLMEPLLKAELELARRNY